MHTFTVYEVQEEIRCRKWLHVVDAEDSLQAIAVLRADQTSEPVDCGELGEPGYGDSGFIALCPSGEKANIWERAARDLARRKTQDSPVDYMQTALTQILVLVRKGARDHDLETIESHCCDALGRAWGVPPSDVHTPNTEFKT